MINERSTEREKFEAEIKEMILNTEELLNVTAGQAGEMVESIRSRVQERLNSVKTIIKGMEKSAAEEVRLAAKTADEYVHNNPWPAIGIAAGFGFLTGWLIGRK